VWREQDPPATDVLLYVTVPFSGGGSPAYLDIDKLTDGTLFEAVERSAESTARWSCGRPRRGSLR
jgi:hypothetical protein